MSILWVALLSSPGAGKTIYVDDDGPADFNNIQAAIDDSNDGDTIIVLPGKYSGAGNRDIDFRGKAIAVRSRDPNDLNIVATTVIDCNGTKMDPYRGFRFHSHETPSSVLAGLTITNGYGPREQDIYTILSSRGGAISCNGSSPTISNCIISNNSASAWGGGIYSVDSNSTITGCTFSGNFAGEPNTYGGWGGALCSKKSNNLTIANCTFIHNQAIEAGGALCEIGGSRSIVTDCTFSNNSAKNRGGGGVYTGFTGASIVLNRCTFNANSANIGGGIYCEEYGKPTIIDCIITANSATIGGGIYCELDNSIISNCFIIGNVAANASYQSRGGGISCEYSSAILKNCVIAGNSSEYGGGVCFYYSNAQLYNCTITGNSASISGDGVCCFGDSRPEMTPKISNSIIWGNSGCGGPDVSSTVPLISYSDIEDGYIGTGNINASPDFVNPATGDYHLSQTSPCIDAGDPSFLPVSGETDIDSEPRVMGTRVDMGADEFTSTPTPVIGVSPPAFIFQATEGGFNPEGQVLYIRNAGFSKLVWNAIDDGLWLEINPYNGESTGEIDAVNLSVDVAGLGLGKYTCELTITADRAPNSPQKVPVTLYIRPVNRQLHVPSEYGTIQMAIDAAQDDDTIILAEGTYTGQGNRDIDFKGKSITVRSTDPFDPCVVATTVIDCNNSGRGFYFHSGEGEGSALTGVTITKGSNKKGSGICIENASPTVTHCIIQNNWLLSYGGPTVLAYGGGIDINRGSPTVSHCVITNNFAHKGGGIHCYSGDPRIEYCLIKDNSSRRVGAGICVLNNSSPVISQCNIIGNVSSLNTGGGVYSMYSSPTIEGCVISHNGSGYGGAGISVDGGRAVISQCTVTDNAASNLWGGGMDMELSSVTISNCIFWNNTAPNGSEIGVYSWSGQTDSENAVSNVSPTAELEISYSNIRGGHLGIYVFGEPNFFVLNWGAGNVDTDPCFAQPGFWSHSWPKVWFDGDYHLKSQAGRWDVNEGGWTKDDVMSPCIDAGDPASPIGLEPFPNGGIINMGAYGGTREASKSYFGEPICETIVAGDINGDCTVNLKDFAFIAYHWLEEH